ncbi:hypothetical protein DVQ35_20530 [Yersinia enterocolitica]|nr:hypothetical protein [Yersinia enterocolitica]
MLIGIRLLAAYLQLQVPWVYVFTAMPAIATNLSRSKLACFLHYFLQIIRMNASSWGTACINQKQVHEKQFQR